MRVQRFFSLAMAISLLFQFGAVLPVKNASAENADCDWPMFGRAPDNNRVAPDGCGPLSGNLKLKWAWDLFANQISSGIAVDNGLLYFGADWNSFFCVNEDSKGVVWKFPMDGSVYGTPELNEGKVFFGSTSKKFYCLNAKSGKKIWEFAGKSEINCKPAVFKGNVYFGSDDGLFVCADSKTGSVVWSYKTGGKVSGKPSFFGNTTIIRSQDWNVYCLDTLTGVKKWSYESSGYVHDTSVVDGGKVYINSGSKVVCLNASNGEMSWEYQANQVITSSATVYDNKVCFATEMFDTKVYCLDATNGQEIWKYQARIEVEKQPVAINGLVFFGSGPYFTCLDLATGDLRWEFTTDDFLLETPTLFKNRVYLATKHKTLVCLNPESGEVVWDHIVNTGSIWGWPMGSPSSHEGKLFIGADDNKVHCLDAQTGKQYWEFRTGYNVKGTPAIWDDKVYFGSLDGNVYCVDEETGKKNWETDIGIGFFSNPSVFDGKVVIGSTNGVFYCFNNNTGKINWKYDTKGYPYESPAIWDQKVYIASGNSIYCLSLEDGSVVWINSAENYSRHWGSLTIYDKKVYSGGSGWFFQCLDAVTGKVLWKKDEYKTIGSMPVCWDGKVYAGSWDNSLYCLNAKTGASIWSFQAKDRVDKSPLICNGMIFFTSSDKFYCLDAKTGARIFDFSDENIYLNQSPSVFGHNVYHVSMYKLYCFSSDAPAKTEDCSFKVTAIRKEARTNAEDVFASYRIDTEDIGKTKPKLSIGVGNLSEIETSRLDYPKTVFAGESFVVNVKISNLSPKTYKIPIVLTGCQTNEKRTVELSLVIVPPDLKEDCEWSVFGKNEDGNRVAPDGCGPKSKWPVKLWEQSSRGYIFHSPVIWNNRVYLGTDQGMLCADLGTGKEIWINSSVGDSWTCTVWNGRTYFGNSKSIVCMDADDGYKYWEYQTGSDIQAVPVISGGLLYIGSDDSYLYCLDPIKGELKWKFKADDSVCSNPVIKGDRIFFHGHTKLYCIDKNDQHVIWEKPMSAGLDISPVYSDGKIFSGSGEGLLYCLDASDGKTIWTYDTNSRIYLSPAVWNGCVYFGDSNGEFRAVDVKTGKAKWIFQANDIIYSSPAICDGKIYFGSIGESFYCLDASNGSLLWSAKAGEKVWSSPAIADGKVVISSCKGKIICFGDRKEPDNRTKPEKLIIYPNNESVDLCQTLQLTAEVVNKNDEVLPGYKFDWSVPSESGTIVENGLFTPAVEGVVYISCKTGNLEGEAEIYCGNMINTGFLPIFENVEPDVPTRIDLEFTQEFDKIVSVRLTSSTDEVTISPIKFDLLPYETSYVELTCLVRKKPPEKTSKFTITVEYRSSKSTKACTMTIEGLIIYK